MWCVGHGSYGLVLLVITSKTVRATCFSGGLCFFKRFLLSETPEYDFIFLKNKKETKTFSRRARPAGAFLSLGVQRKEAKKHTHALPFGSPQPTR
jgi:hypothetical protein